MSARLRLVARNLRHVVNGDGTVSQLDADTGRLLVRFSDPDGSFTREHLEPALAATAQARPQGEDLTRIMGRAHELTGKREVRPGMGRLTLVRK